MPTNTLKNWGRKRSNAGCQDFPIRDVGIEWTQHRLMLQQLDLVLQPAGDEDIN